MSELAGWICSRQERLSRDRGTWESHWQEIADRVLPRYSDTFQRAYPVISKGEKRTEKMFDATAAIAVEQFASVMESMLTPRGRRWHRLVPSDPALARNRNVAEWFEQATEYLFKYRYAPNANYASQQFETYVSLGAFGTGALFIDSHDDGGLRYHALHLQEVYFDLNYQGLVDTAFRVFHLSARQIMQRKEAGRFESVHEEIERCAEVEPEKLFKIVHCVKPRGDYQPERVDPRGLPFGSYYVDATHKEMMNEGGFASFPYAISRYTTGPGEIYGRGPAMLALPAIKTLNEQKKTLLKQGHRSVDPPLLVHDDGVMSDLNITPGAVNYGGVNAQGQLLVRPLPVGNLQVNEAMMGMEQSVINQAFKTDMFRLMQETTRMTATEIIERSNERSVLLGPTMGRQQSEGLGPMIVRELALLLDQGLLPEMPPELEEAAGEYEIEYDSPISRQSRTEEVSGYLRTIEPALQLAQVTGNPGLLDIFDFEKILRNVAEINGMPVGWLADEESVEAKRQERAQQQAVEQAVQAAPAAAAMMRGGGGGSS